MENNENLELESQFILRLPPVQAASLRAAVRSGVNLKERLRIQIDDDMRHGFVQFDDYHMPSRIYDLPTIIESYKTLDKKNLYKTADIAQIMICKASEDKETVVNAGKREFLFPHGITPPLKNVRKKRFRKTLKKKFVDYDEIEDEVKRLFKADHEAIAVRYEVVDSTTNKNESTSETQRGNALAVDLFGDDDLSSSDEGDDADVDNDNDIDVDVDDGDDGDEDDMGDESYGDSRYGQGSSNAPTTFDNIIPQSIPTDADLDSLQEAAVEGVTAGEAAAEEAAAEEAAAQENLIAQNDVSDEKLLELEREIKSLRTRRHAQEMEMEGIDNDLLKQRLKSFIDNLRKAEDEKVRQLESLRS